MNPLDRLYAQFAKENKDDPLKALATEVVNGKPLSEIPKEQRNDIEKIIVSRKMAIDQVIMWS